MNKILTLNESNKEDKKGVYIPESYHNSVAVIESVYLPILEHDFQKYLIKNETVISTYLYWKDKIEEIRYRINPPFTLTIIKNRQSNPSIVAKVKWIYKFKGEYKKTPYISVYIGSIEQYPKGLKDSKLFYDVPKKIQEYLNKVCPIELNPSS
jgi:hypothetical protein